MNISFSYQSIRICFTLRICNMLSFSFAFRGKLHRKQSKHGSIHRGVHSWM